MTDANRMARIVEKGLREVYVFAAETLLIEYANESARRDTGYAAEELAQRTPLALMPAFGQPAFEALIWPLRDGSQDIVSFEALHRRKDGTTYPVEVSIRFLADEGRPAFVAYVADITPRRTQEEQLRYLAYNDALTGLPNRVLLHDRLQQAVSQADRSGKLVALMFLDLDRFKVINDTLGHRTGDLVLAAAAERLSECVRKSDTVARLGGDEFAVIYGNCNQPEDVAKLGDRILEAFAKPFSVDGHQAFIGTSAGITMYPTDAGDVDRLLQNADLAMYRAKEQGGSNYQFYVPAMNAAIQDRLVLETELRRALEQGEFMVHYQPQIALQSGEIVGVEALVRWQHPSRGLLLPEMFLPVAEDSGLIVAIGEWVLRQACVQNKAWMAAGLPPLLLAVNLSAAQVKQQNLVTTVTGALQNSGLEPQYLELELTENTRGPATNLQPLHRLGVKIALDDFGTGYSPLSYLRGYPVHKVKIDRSFVGELATDANSTAMTRGVIALAHSLHLSVVAEGVETAAQMEFLRRNQCDGAQGYYFSPAVPADAFDRLLREAIRNAAGLSFGSGTGQGVWAFWSRQPRAAA